MADIRILEPLITWPKNFIFGGVRGLFEGMRQAAPWGMRIGAVAGAVAGLGAFGPIALLGGAGPLSAVTGFVLGGAIGVPVALVGGGVIGAIGGAIHGLTNSGADHHIVEDRRFKKREQSHAKKYDIEKDPNMYHYLDDLYDNDPGFVDTLEEEREAAAELAHARER